MKHVRDRKYRKFGMFLRDDDSVDLKTRRLVGFDEMRQKKNNELEKALSDSIEACKMSKDPKTAKKLRDGAQKELDLFQEEQAQLLTQSMEANKAAIMEMYQVAKARVVRKCMQKLVDEIRGSQIYVDKSGIPTMRKKAKTSLRKV